MSDTKPNPRKSRAKKSASGNADASLPVDPSKPVKAPKQKPSPEEVRRKELMKNARKNKARIMSQFGGMKEATNSQLLDMATYNLTGAGQPAEPSPSPAGESSEEGGSPSE